MSIILSGERRKGVAIRGFTLFEVLVSCLLIGVMALSLYVGMSQGFSVIQLARENLRATQILQEKMEAIRLVSWTQLNTEGFIPRTFTAPFYATEQDGTDGLMYSGQVIITNVPFSQSYSSDLRMVVAEVTWMAGSVPRHRSMCTLVSEYGLQNYIYNPD
jgi:prepilin-type N-terminal cleavage/methylation domain-containing protein